MESKRPVSREQSGLETPKPGEFKESVNAEVGKSNAETHKAVEPDVSYAITGELLRALIDQKTKPSRFHAISTHPLIVVIAGGLTVGLLTNYYTYRQKDIDYNRSLQQQELARQQSFSDELNKTRVQKLGEVWERLDEDEFTINRLLDDSTFEGPNTDSSSNNKRVDDIRRLIHDDQAMASRYRFWLGEKLFHKTTGYLDINIEYALNKLTAPRGTNLSELIKKRDDAKQDILEIRRLFLEGEPGPQSKRVDH